jgi:stress response protein YsnF
VVTTEVVPVERVRVVRYVVTTPQVVGGTVRREVLEVNEEVIPGR